MRLDLDTYRIILVKNFSAAIIDIESKAIPNLWNKTPASGHMWKHVLMGWMKLNSVIFSVSLQEEDSCWNSSYPLPKHQT